MALFCHIVKVLFLDDRHPVGVGRNANTVYANSLAETRDITNILDQGRLLLRNICRAWE